MIINRGVLNIDRRICLYRSVDLPVTVSFSGERIVVLLPQLIFKTHNIIIIIITHHSLT